MAGSWTHFVDVEEGLEEIAAEELAAMGASVAKGAGGLLLAVRSQPERLLRARTIGALYRREVFDVPRPKALLGSQHFTRLVRSAKEVSDGAAEPFTALRIAAAGADSSVFRRLAAELGEALGLEVDQADGDLLLRVRPASDGWEVLVRTTRRPLSARSWRVCNLPGGINATVAVVMNRLVGEVEGQRYLNLMCGSGTLVIERALSSAPASALVGVDRASEALRCAADNLAAAAAVERSAARAAGAVRWLAGDVRTLDLGESFEVITADAPWGDAVGEHAGNEALHAALLECAARHAARGASFALLSHEVKITGRCVAASRQWRERRRLRVSHGGHRPLLVLLERV